MAAPVTITCPGCSAVLIIEGVEPERVLLCAGCRRRLYARGGLPVRRTSRKAVASLVCGLASLLGLCLTGIPAVILGTLALWDIYRRRKPLRGQGLAIAGIVTGILCGGIGTPVAAVVLRGAWNGWQLGRSVGAPVIRDPGELARLADRMPPCRLPPGFRPVAGQEAQQARMIVYEADPPRPYGMIVLVQFPRTFEGQTGVMYGWTWPALDRLRPPAGIRIDQSEALHWTIHGTPVVVMRNVGKARDGGEPRIEYYGVLHDAEGPVIAFVRTAEGAGAKRRWGLTEDEVRRFFESIQ